METTVEKALTEKDREMAELEKAATATDDSSKVEAASYTNSAATRAARVD